MDHRFVQGDPYFDDGNLLLVTAVAQGEPTAFKVHRGVLRRHSEVFEDMFSSATQSTDQAQVDGCPMVVLHDLPCELGNLIKALYDGATFETFGEGIQNFFYTAGILRLATKYFIRPLRLSAIRALQKSWSSTLQGHDAMIQKAIDSPMVYDMTYPYAHPLAVINLAKEVHVDVLIPPALYFLSLYPLNSLLRADHPKLVYEHPSRPSAEMSSDIVRHYVIMYQARVETILDFVRKFVGERIPNAGCQHPRNCSKGFAKLGSHLGKSWQTRTGPLHYMLQGVRYLQDDGLTCPKCRRDFEQAVSELRDEVWAKLPSLAGFDCTWEELEKKDLA
ncbi:hypothetical protein DL96DRAFT_1612366 [Flagelloscypha sp. PMI_526]|nr:hypothetical protein DL96DRAFT_1612366 [Flagelloscypha sp. PMI_526]